jgi:hypothetical protein
VGVAALNILGFFKWIHWTIVEYRVLPLLVLTEVICLVVEYLRMAAIATRMRSIALGNTLRGVSFAQALALSFLLLWGLATPSESVQWLTIVLSCAGAAIGTIACVWLMAVLIRRGRAPA